MVVDIRHKHMVKISHFNSVSGLTKFGVSPGGGGRAGVGLGVADIVSRRPIDNDFEKEEHGKASPASPFSRFFKVETCLFSASTERATKLVPAHSYITPYEEQEGEYNAG